jgi:hypothetical protein
MAQFLADADVAEQVFRHQLQRVAAVQHQFQQQAADAATNETLVQWTSNKKGGVSITSPFFVCDMTLSAKPHISYLQTRQRPTARAFDDAVFQSAHSL